MRILLFVASFGIFAFLFQFSVPNKQGKPIQSVDSTKIDTLKKKASRFRKPQYNFDIDFDELHRSLFVKQKILWFNNSSDTLSELRFNVFPSAYTTNESQFFSIQPALSSDLGKFEIKNFFVNGFPSKLIFDSGTRYSNNLSPSGKTQLLSPLLPEDSVQISMEFFFKLPKSTSRCGYARGTDFYLVMDWYPEIADFQGDWKLVELHPFAGKNSTPFQLTAEITIPDSFNFVSSGVVLGNRIGKRKIIHCEAENLRDFVWLTFAENSLIQKLQTIDDISAVQIYLHPEKEYKEGRIASALQKSFEFFRNNFGSDVFDNFTIVDLPKTSLARNLQFKDFALIRSSVIEADRDFSLERQICSAVAGQFINSRLTTDNYNEYWISGGFKRYLTEKIIETEYHGEVSTFKFATYFPVYGVDYLFYREIPVMYSLSHVEKPPLGDELLTFYSNPYSGVVLQESNSFYNSSSFETNVFSKPAVIWKFYENLIGERAVYDLIDSLDGRADNQRLSGDSVLAELDEVFPVRHLFSSSAIFDYKIESVERMGDSLYRVSVIRMEEGIVPTQIALYTEKDTLYQSWSGGEVSKDFYFTTKDSVIAAEIDPFRQNPFDINFSNNSYVVGGNYGARISLSVRWFFWVQNALIVLGSVG